MSYETATKIRYQSYYEKYGNTPMAMGWKTPEKIELRFKILKEIGIEENNNILDVGCGLGYFYDYLSKKLYNIKYFGKYIGIDIVPEFIYFLKEKYRDSDSNCDFKLCTIDDIKEKYDWVVESGIFNHCSTVMPYIEKTMKQAYELCNNGVAFNFVSSYVEYHNPEMFYTDPKEIFDIAKKLSKFVILRHDYLPYEFTIYIYKNR